MNYSVLRTSLLIICIGSALSGRDVDLCAGRGKCAGRNPLIGNIRILQQNGARPHWSPSGDAIVFDRRDASGYAHLYLSDLQGNVTSLTEGKAEVGSGNSGNGVFDPAGKYIVFIAEEPRHFLKNDKTLGDPGLGMFCNLWATTRDGSRFWRLTDIPIRQGLLEKLPVMGVVNPHFAPDGRSLVWTERYDKASSSWGAWRVRSAEFTVANGTPRLENERTIVNAGRGNYVTAMGFVNADQLLVAGNLDGQPEYGMDQYLVNLASNKTVNLTNTPDLWEEGSCITPIHRKIIYMSNQASPYKLDFANSNWAAQIIERDYFMMDSNGDHKTRLTYFNDPSAPEFLGGRNIVAACDVSADGRSLAGTLGIDGGGAKRSNMQLKVVILNFTEPL